MQTHESGVNLSGAGGVDVARLERELTSMWRGATGGGEESGVMRACVLNLIVYAPVGEGREAIDALLDEVYESNPSRSLVLFADRAAADERLDAYVSTRCSLSSKGSRQICGEQITIEAAGGAVERAASAVAPLLVPDVPVFLWWKDIPHYEDKLFARLVEISDRVVIDSAFFDHPREDLSRLARVIGENPEHMAVSDLNWGRLTPWRALVAGFWDVRENLPALRALDRVLIRFAPTGGADAQTPPAALLLAGWLASRLGWEVGRRITEEGNDADSVELKTADGRAVVLSLERFTGGACGAGGLRSATFYSSEAGAEFCVETAEDGRRLETATATGAGGRRVGRLLDYAERSEGESLGGELAILTRDKVYEAAVAAAARVLDVLAPVKSS